MRGFKQKVSFYSFEEFKSLIEKGKSFIRLGDGEIYMINFGSIHYQEYDQGLRDSFLKMIENYSNEAQYILEINQLSMEKTNAELRKREHNLL